MAELSLKDVKAVLDDNDLDLSMRQLTQIPVKILAKLPRATHLDFSNNAIVAVPREFCFLTHITQLDLSNNHISCLPENFGQLINLCHLDLYKNQIKGLPLSFGELTSLKWLDVKGNPLEAELAKAAGDCLDAQGCRLAAVRVVQLMKSRQTQHKLLTDRQNEIAKERKEREAHHEEQSVPKEATKKKKNKHKDLLNNHAPPVAKDIQHDGRGMSSASKQNPGGTVMKKEQKRAWRNRFQDARLLRWIFGALPYILFVFGIFVCLTVMFNCLREPQHWISTSRPFCTDVEKLFDEKVFSWTIVINFLQAFLSTVKACGEAMILMLVSIWETDFMKYSLSAVYAKLVSTKLLLHGYFLHMYEDVENFCSAYLSETFNNTVKGTWLVLRIIGLMLADFMLILADKGLLFVSTVVDNIFMYKQHSYHIFDAIREWWNDLV